MGNEYAPSLEKHGSQKDYATGFGGKYGVQKDHVDKVLTHTLRSKILNIR